MIYAGAAKHSGPSRRASLTAGRGGGNLLAGRREAGRLSGAAENH
jgi:hypothetical protein